MVLESGDRFEDSRAMGGGNASSMPHQAQPWIVSVGNQRFVFNTHNSKLIIAEAVGRATALSYNDRQNEANSMFHWKEMWLGFPLRGEVTGLLLPRVLFSLIALKLSYIMSIHLAYFIMFSLKQTISYSLT